MIVKRLGAAVLAIALIVGAWVVRERFIEDDSSTADAAPLVGTQIVCASELRDACQAAIASTTDATLEVVDVAATLDDLVARPGAPAATTLPVWITFEPFPGMVELLRQRAGSTAIDATATQLARSPLAAIAHGDRGAALVERCGEVLDLACLGDITDLKPTFSPSDTAIGALGVAAAVADFRTPVDLSEPEFLAWAKRVKAARAQSLNLTTAVQTVQTRTTFVAIGASAELADINRETFTTVVGDPPTMVAVTLWNPAGLELPPGFLEAITGELLARGWEIAAPGEPTGLPEPEMILAINEFWETVR